MNGIRLPRVCCITRLSTIKFAKELTRHPVQQPKAIRVFQPELMIVICYHVGHVSAIIPIIKIHAAIPLHGYDWNKL